METTHNYLFVSDFHLSEGRDPKTGLLSRSEDFLNDGTFAQFLAYHVALSRREDAPDYYGKPWKLVINGDIFDFLQVVSLPAAGDELFAVRGVRTYAELSLNERVYGLGTRPAEIVWKLKKIAAGHPLFFQTLAWFVAHEGNELVLLKGNHDIEIFWPDVQQTIRELLAQAYQAWYQQARVPKADASPLVYYAGLPAALSEPDLQTSVQCPPLFYYEKDLFYVEHGCQYDSTNSFTNFENPILPDDPERVELPSGSLFVRYYFNKVEEVQPFADNVRPMTRYFKWVIQNTPSAAFHFLAVLLPKYAVALLLLQVKKWRDGWRRMWGRKRPFSPHSPTPFQEALLAMQVQAQKQFRSSWRKTIIAMISSVILTLVTIHLFLVTVRHFVSGNYTWLGVNLGIAIVLGFIASVLFHSLDRFFVDPYLLRAAEKICALPARPGELGAVRYYIFGHDHIARLRELTCSTKHNRQWYVNTGAWVPLFKEENRLLRGDDLFTFLRLIPGHPAFGQGIPELWQWQPEANQPRQICLFAGR